MSEPSSKKSIIALGDWLDTPAGRYVRRWEQARLNQLTVDIFGFNAVQIGLPEFDTLEASRMTNRWVTAAAASAAHGYAGKQAEADDAGGPTATALRRIAVAHDFTELPFASQSLDLVLLPHVLEFAAEPHQILREVERVLIPEGQVIVCGFNPASMWGARQIAARLRGREFLPPHSELIGMPRLKDWLKLLNMEVGRGHFGCYAPGCASDKWLNRFHFMESVGERWWPFLGAVYIVQAIKRVKGMRLVGPVWAPQLATARAGVPVANRNIDHQHVRTEQQYD